MLWVLLEVVINEFGFFGWCGVILVGIGLLVIFWVVFSICLLEKLVEELRLKVLDLFLVKRYLSVRRWVLVRFIM